MKHVLLIITLLLVNVCITQERTFDRDLMSFSELTINGKFTVSITQSNRNHVSYSIWDQQLKEENIQFIFAGDGLEIKYNGPLLSERDMHFDIEVVRLTQFTAKNGGEIELKSNFDMNDSPVTINIQFGGNFIGTITNSPKVFASVSQGGSIQLKGKSKHTEFNVTTGGSINAKELEAEYVYAKVKFGGTITCFANTFLDAKVVSGGSILYDGEGQVIKEIKLGGNINRL